MLQAKNYYWLLLIFIATSFLHCGQPPQEEEDAGYEPPFQCEENDCVCGENDACAETDLFALEHLDHYTPFSSSDAVSSQWGFGTYHDDYEYVGVIVRYGELTLDAPEGAAGAGGQGPIEYDETLSVQYDKTSWLSIRREFVWQTDLCGCTGIEFDVNSLENDGGYLRFTLADLECTQQAMLGLGEDELWWSDLDDALIPFAEWETVRLPFDTFRESYGSGTRHNNGELGLKCIKAIEFNILGGGSGHFLIRNVRTYAD